MKQGICIDCGYVYVPFENDGGCPACRAAKIRETFKPVNPERTAQAIPGSFRVGKTGEITHINWNEESREAEAVKNWYYRQTCGTVPALIVEQTEVPKGCKMPKGDAAQCYELRRMFRIP